MPIQAPQWTDYLNCPACCREFAPSRSPISLGCGHTLCRICLKNLHRRQCPFDQTMISVDLEELVVNTALLQLAGYTPPSQPYHPPCIQALSELDRHAYDVIVKSLEQLAVFLKFCGNANMMGSRLSRPMQRKLVTLLQCAMTDEEGRGKAARAARSLGERTVTELIVQHQNPQQLSANLWAAVRSRGCQFLGPAMQEEVLKLVLLALEDGSALSRKVLVMFVVQRLEPHFPQASKTSIGHVVQLLYRASCFKVSKRVCDSSLMQLKEEFRTYDSLRREHDAQIVQIATEAGLRIAPDQWSALLYGDTQHKSHMQSIIDKLQTPQSFAQSVQELFITLQRTGDPAQLITMSLPLDCLANIDASPDAKNPTWQQLSTIITALKEVVSRLVHFMQQQSTGRDSNHNARVIDRLPEPPSQQSTAQGLPGRYKVAMCRDAQTRTYCPRGNNCTYAHSEEELERYRRINTAVGSYPYVMQPVVAVAHPIYQRYSVPPPPLPNMEHNYNMPPMQQQGSPSSRGSLVGVDAMDREQSYESSYELDREKSYDHREKSYDHRDQSYERPPPNASADNYAASYANVLMHGGPNSMARRQNSHHERQHQNGNRSTMIPPHSGYYPRYSEHAGYPYMQHIDTGRMNNEEMPQYPGMGSSVASDPTHDYTEYPQMNYMDENVADLHFESRPYGASVLRQMPIAQQQAQEPAWQAKNTMKSPPMFKFDERAKNVPAGMEIGKSMPIGIDMGRNVPIGTEKGKNMPIGMELAKNMPIGMEMGKKIPIGMEVGNNLSMGMDMMKTVPIGMAQTNGEMMLHGMDNVRMKPKMVIRTETEKRDYQELEKELKALEQRISTEFSKASDQVDTDVEE